LDAKHVQWLFAGAVRAIYMSSKGYLWELRAIYEISKDYLWEKRAFYDIIDELGLFFFL
jgi:hypothetical protein